MIYLENGVHRGYMRLSADSHGSDAPLQELRLHYARSLIGWYAHAKYV